MKTRIQKWGNSLAIRIPKSFAEDAGLHSESEVELCLIDGELVIRATDKGKKKFPLEVLLEQMTEENLHGEMDFGAPVGDEVW